MVGTASWTDPVLDSLAEANEDVPRLADNAPTYEVLLGADPDFVTASFGRHYNPRAVSSPASGSARPVSARTSRRRTATTARASTAVPLARHPSPSTRCTRRSGSWRRSSTSPTAASSWSPTCRSARRPPPRASTSRGGPSCSGSPTPRPRTSRADWARRRPWRRRPGMENVFTDAADDWPAVGWESVVEADPDILVLGDLQRDRFPGDLLDDKIEFLAAGRADQHAGRRRAGAVHRPARRGDEPVDPVRRRSGEDPGVVVGEQGPALNALAAVATGPGSGAAGPGQRWATVAAACRGRRPRARRVVVLAVSVGVAVTLGPADVSLVNVRDILLNHSGWPRSRCGPRRTPSCGRSGCRGPWSPRPAVRGSACAE